MPDPPIFLCRRGLHLQGGVVPALLQGLDAPFLPDHLQGRVEPALLQGGMHLLIRCNPGLLRNLRECGGKGGITNKPEGKVRQGRNQNQWRSQAQVVALETLGHHLAHGGGSVTQKPT